MGSAFSRAPDFVARRLRYSRRVGKFGLRVAPRPRLWLPPEGLAVQSHGVVGGLVPRGAAAWRMQSPGLTVRGATPLRMCNRKCRSHTWCTEHVGACHVILHAGLFRGLGFVATNHRWTPYIRFHTDTVEFLRLRFP